MRIRARAPGALVALVVVAGMLIPAQPAAAAVPIIGSVTAVVAVAKQVKTAYDAVIHYLTDPAKPPSDLEQIKAAIAQSTVDVKAEIDSVATGQVKDTCDQTLIQFEDINNKTPAQLEDFRNLAVSCVTAAREQISAQSTPGTLDVLALALNIGAPIALAASRKAGDSTNLLTQIINDGNRALLEKPQLKPTCKVTPDAGVDVYQRTFDAVGAIPGTGGEAPIPGHGTCYNYMVTAPTPTQGSVLYYPTGPNTGVLPWSVVGDGQIDFCAGVFTCGHAHVNWPSTGQWDFSIASEQAMASTSYPIVRAALDRLAPPTGPAGQPVTMVTETATNEIFSPIDVFGVTSTGDVLRGQLTDTNHDDVDNGSFPHDTWHGWQAFGGPTLAAGTTGPGFTVTSLASATNWDGRVQVFAVDRIGNLFTRWQVTARNDTAWTPWAHLDGTVGSVAVARNKDGRLQLFATTPDGQLVSRFQVMNTFTEFAGPYAPTGTGSVQAAKAVWTPWKPVNVNSTVAQVAATSREGRIELYALHRTGSMVVRRQSAVNTADFSVAGNWSDWTSVAGPTVAGSALPLRGVQAFPDMSGKTNLMVTAYGSVQYHQVADATGWVQVPGTMYGGFGATKEGGGAGANEMFGVDATGKVYYTFSGGSFSLVGSTWTPAAWHSWLPVTGATLRAYQPGPSAGPVLIDAGPGAAAGTKKLTWTDMSTAEDAFAVFRYSTAGQFISEAADLPTTDKPGFGGTVTFTDTTPSAAAPCYLVEAYDNNGLIAGASDVLCPVPGVTGATQAAAMSTVTGAGFIIGTVTPINDCVATGTIRAQNPAAGRATWHSPVDLSVATCTSTVPQTIGMTQAAATSAITGAGLTLGTVTPVNACVNPGTVLSQVPLGNTAAPKGSAVTLKVYTCVVPNVLGLTQSSAAATFGGSGLSIGAVSTVNNCVNPGTVSSQNPPAGTSVSPTTLMNLTVTTCTVPDVRGSSQASATGAITGAGLRLGTVRQVEQCTDPGSVWSQSPSAGTAVAPNSTVNITMAVCKDGSPN